MISNYFKFEVKYGFEDLGEINNFLHRIFFRFRMDLELKFREFSRLQFDRISYSLFLKLCIWMKLGPSITVCT
jgi:hypothetical protein